MTRAGRGPTDYGRMMNRNCPLRYVLRSVGTSLICAVSAWPSAMSRFVSFRFPCRALTLIDCCWCHTKPSYTSTSPALSLKSVSLCSDCTWVAAVLGMRVNAQRLNEFTLFTWSDVVQPLMPYHLSTRTPLVVDSSRLNIAPFASYQLVGKMPAT